MKRVVTSTGNTVSADFDKRFGRCAWFCVVDKAAGTVEFVENVNKDDNNAAGTKASETMAKLGINRVISGNFGPKAKDLLDELNIQMVMLQEDGLSVQDVIDKMK